jgi:hypothetical protein
MTQQQPAPRRVDASSLWAGGAAAAFVAALVAIAGIVICRGVFDIAVLAPKGAGVWGDADTVTYAVGAAVAALVATGLMHLLLLSTPRPNRFFGWIMVLATAIAFFAPFAGKASMESKLATAVINLAIGIAIGTLVASSARSAVRKAAIAAQPRIRPPTYPNR